VQPEPQPADADATHTIVLDKEGYWMAEEGATHTQNVIVELGLSQTLPQSQTPEVHTQMVATEPCSKLGEPGGLEKVAHMQLVAMEPDLKCGQPGDPDLITHTYLASVKPNDLPIKGKDDWLEVEGEETAINAAVEEDADPHIDLQGNGVSHLTMLKEDNFLTFLSAPLHTTLEAARTQHSPLVDKGTLPVEGPELSSHTNMVLPPLDTPPPEEAAEPLISGLPKQIPAPIDVGELMESLTGKAWQCTTQHKCQALAWALEGEEPFGEVHGCPPDLLYLHFEDSIALEPGIIVPKAWKPTFDKGECTCPDLWPGPGAITIDLDVYQRASVLLEGEQNKILPCVGSEQHAAPCTPHPFPFSPSLNTCAHSIAPGKGATPIQHTIDPHLEVLKPPHLCEDPLEEPGGVGLRPVHVTGKVGAETLGRMAIDAHEPRGVPLDTNPTPAPTEDTTGIKLIGVAKKATMLQCCSYTRTAFLNNNQEGLGSKERGGERESPHRLNRRLERKC